MLHRHRILGAALLAAALLLAASACSRDHAPLEGTSWRLVGWTISSVYPGDHTITAQFSQGRISGKSAVNSYGGRCQVGPGSAFAVDTIEVTLMAGPEEAMRAERAYLTLLRQARNYRVEEGMLTLFDGGGNQLLIYGAAD